MLEETCPTGCSAHGQFRQRCALSSLLALSPARIQLYDSMLSFDLNNIVLSLAAAMFKVYHNAACIGHNIAGHPERPERVRDMLLALLKQFPSSEFAESPACTDEHILLFHTKRHLSVLKDKCNRAESTRRPQNIDGDTAVMAGTRAAVYHAAGAPIAAVDAVYSPERPEDRLRAAFCCTRPPGHHAETNTSMGFCFVNNAGVAARYAQSRYGIGRVAVVDFDVHHGNGVEEGFLRDETLFYGSTHEKDNYPGTGVEPKKIGEEAAVERDRRIVNRFLDSGKRSKAQFRTKWLQIMAEMQRFKPELVIISAGFDAHKNDPLGGCALEEEDFAWATQAVLDVCTALNEKDPIPCISVLEGGYNIKAISRSAVAHCDTLRSWVAEKQHLSQNRAQEEVGMATEEGHSLTFLEMASTVSAVDDSKEAVPVPCAGGKDSSREEGQAETTPAAVEYSESEVVDLMRGILEDMCITEGSPRPSSDDSTNPVIDAGGDDVAHAK